MARTRVVCSVLVCLGLAWAPARAWAQTGAAPGEVDETEVSRAAEAEALRRAKAAALEPYRPVLAESVLLYIEDTRLVGRVFDPVEGWFAQVGGLSEGAGVAGGGGYRTRVGRAGAADARGLVSWNGAFLAGARWRSTPLAHDRFRLGAETAIERHTDQEFFGLGPHATQRFDSDYELDERRATMMVDVRVARWMTVGAAGGYTAFRLHDLSFDFDDEDDELDFDRGRDDPQVRQYLDGAIPGLDTRPTLADVEASIVIDTRSLLTAAGARVAVRHGWHHDVGATRHTFQSTQVDVQQFLPFWNGTRTLALAVAAERVEPAGGHAVPFYLQPALGGSRRLRGFDRQRFRDTSALVLQAEYRYDINPFVAGVLFVETGQVAPDWSRLRVRGFRGDYGVGIRFGYGGTVAVRSDVAFGGEGPRLVIALSGVF